MRLCGIGRFGESSQGRWDYSIAGEVWVEAHDEGPDFHVLIRGKFAKHALYSKTRDDTWAVEQRQLKDPYFRWSQRALQEEGEIWMLEDAGSELRKHAAA